MDDVAKKQMMFALPEVDYLVSRIPAARHVIEPDAVILRYLQHARETGISLKAQCKALGVPWCLRKVPAEFVANDGTLAAAYSVSSVVSPHDFSARMPDNAAEFARWVQRVQFAAIGREMTGPSLRWWVYHATEAGADECDELVDYLRLHAPIDDVRISLANVRNKSVQWHNDIRLRRVEREMLYRRDEAMIMYNIMGSLGERQPVWLREGHQYEPRCLAEFSHNGFTARLLDTYDDFSAEGRAMHHCVASYYQFRLRGRAHIASVRKGRKRVATVEFDTEWRPRQVKGPCNSAVVDQRVHAVIEAFAGHMLNPAPEASSPEPEAFASSPTEERRPVLSVSSRLEKWRSALPKRLFSNGGVAA